MALLKELNAADDALDLMLKAQARRVERPTVDVQVLEESVMMYLVKRSLAVLLQLALDRNARRAVLKHAGELGLTKFDLQAVA